MVKLYTIGFTKKDARTFFELLLKNGIRKVIDVRLNNVSQLAGFTKRQDLQYFLQAIAGIKYIHAIAFAPTIEMLSDYKRKKIAWKEYETMYINLMKSRVAENVIHESELADSCLLCSEPTPSRCHRRLLAEYLQSRNTSIEIIHL
jgi:uncharacterized protein (DUF488 family)